MELASGKAAGVQCPECGKGFPKQKNLKAHMPRVHHKCDFCEKTFMSKSSRNKHMLSHGNAPFTCLQCGKPFLEEKSLNLHLRKHAPAPPEETNVQCLECGNYYLNQKRLKIHMAKHGPRASYKCDVCDKVFAMKWIRNTHARCHGELSYKCSFCDAAFWLEAAWKRHEQKHAGERTHVCHVCGKGYLFKHGLGVHMTTHTGEKPYSCSRCGKGFRKRVQCNSHIRRECGPATEAGERPPLVLREPPPRPPPRPQPEAATFIYTIIPSVQVVSVGNAIILPYGTGGPIQVGGGPPGTVVGAPPVATA